MSHPKPVDPYHGHPREPPAPKHGEQFPGGSHELFQHRERVIMKMETWVNYFNSFFRPQGPGEAVIPHPSYDQMSIQTKTDYIHRAENLTKTGIGEPIQKMFKTFVGPPYTAKHADLARAVLRVGGEITTLSTSELPTNTNLVLGRIIKMSQDVSGLGSVDTYRAPWDKLQLHNIVKAEHDKVRTQIDLLLEHVSAPKEEKQMYSQWLSNPDASVWKTVAEAIKGFNPANYPMQSAILLNTITACSPIDSIYIKNKRIKEASEFLFGIAKERFESTLAEVTQTNTPTDAYDKAMQDAVYEVVIRISFGMEGLVPDRMLMPRQASAIVIAETNSLLRGEYPPPP